MAMTPQTYNDPKVYNKYTAGSCSCEDKENCSCGKGNSCKDAGCPCCPVGTVAVYDSEGEPAGCLTPNDAEKFIADTIQPDNGFVKLYSNDGIFLGIVTVADALIYQAANP